MKKAQRWARLLQIFPALFWLHWQLRRKGFHRLFPPYIQAYPVTAKAEPSPKLVEDLQEWMELIDIACRLVPWEARCLHRSFLGFRFLRQRLHLPVELVVGVQKFPFSAHAWLSLNNRSLNEDPNFVSRFAVILDSGRFHAS